MEPEQAFKQSASVIQFLPDFNLETFEGMKKAWNSLYNGPTHNFSQNNRFINCASGLLHLLKSHG